MFRPFLYAVGLVLVLVVGAFGYFAFAPIPVEAKPVISDISVTDIIKEAPAPVPTALPAAVAPEPVTTEQPAVEPVAAPQAQ